jgi:hypothetical protein
MMADDPAADAARDNADRVMIENASADAAAGILPGGVAIDMPPELVGQGDPDQQEREAGERKPE